MKCVLYMNLQGLWAHLRSVKERNLNSEDPWCYIELFCLPFTMERYESMKRYVKPNKITAHLHSPAEAVQPCRLAR